MARRHLPGSLQALLQHRQQSVRPASKDSGFTVKEAAQLLAAGYERTPTQTSPWANLVSGAYGLASDGNTVGIPAVCFYPLIATTGQSKSVSRQDRAMSSRGTDVRFPQWSVHQLCRPGVLHSLDVCLHALC